MERGREDFGKPNPIRTNKFRNKDKLCAYHNEAGHNTSECWALRDAIEDLIRRGQLRDYVVQPTNQSTQQLAQQPTPPDDERSPAVRTIYTIHDGPQLAGTSHKSHERNVREVNHVLLTGSNGQAAPMKRARGITEEITFSEEEARDVHWPHNDALVIRAWIGNAEVRRIMVDIGNSVNVMWINLPFTVGDADRQATTLTEFFIVDCPSAYNVVRGRPTMNDLDMVTFTRSQTVKFPTPNRIGSVRGEQHLARRCYEDAIKMGVKGKKVKPVARSDPQPAS
ncbi:uncharacterized protein LOC127793516 [Diospyros lotus]|uniref:uncharacterized protein LOC127793516 n=1 Tax=Diospyros lotus TaxID=55363 RepID=UPI002251847C|nr:uncharacterized protein LOC127793516 [Diospyros lotus]